MGPATCRLLGLVSRTLCVSAIPIVVLAFGDHYFSPLPLKELLIQFLGLLTFLTWWAGKRADAGPESSSRIVFLPNPLAKPLFFLAVWALFSIAWTTPKQMALQHWMILFSLMLFFPPLFDFGRSWRFRRLCLVTILAVGAVLVVLAACQLNDISLFGWLRVGGGNTRTRLSLTIGHNNGVAPIVLVTSILALGAVTKTRILSFKIGLVLLAIACWGLILFGLLTRSTILGLIAGGAILVLLNLLPLFGSRQGRSRATYSRRRKIILWVVLLILLCSVTWMGVLAVRGGPIAGEYNPNLAQNFLDRVRTLNPDFLRRDTRARLWAISAVMIRNNPLLGLGLSSAKYEYPYYQAAFFEKYPDYPAGPTQLHTERLHNDYLQWVVENGPLGGIFLLWCFFVLAETARIWLSRTKRRGGGDWFFESTILVACLVLFMDALFSFPAHIAPITIYLPFLAMLWFGALLRGPKSPSPSWLRYGGGFATRALIAGVIWCCLVLPLGPNKDGVPWLANSGVWSPITTQVAGRGLQNRLASLRQRIFPELRDIGTNLYNGIAPSVDHFSERFNWAKGYCRRTLAMAPLLPFSGEAVYEAADGHFDFYRFLTHTKPYVDRLNQTGWKLPKKILQEYGRRPYYLRMAGSLYQATTLNYQYHRLHWVLGEVRLELSELSGVDNETKKDLVEKAKRSLKSAQDIAFKSDRAYQELDIYLRVDDATRAAQLAQVVVDDAWPYLQSIAIPYLAEKQRTRPLMGGKRELIKSQVDILRTLLPQLGKGNLHLTSHIIEILDFAGETDLAREYLHLAKKFAKKNLPRPYWEYRLMGPPDSIKHYSDALESYRNYVEEGVGYMPIFRAFFLNDHLNFAPEGTNLEEWRREMERLLVDSDGTFVVSIACNLMAHDAAEGNDWAGSWSWKLRSHAHGRSTERRAAIVDSHLWGIAWPLWMY